ncbi:ATP-binding protein [Actinoplanes sp. GCM10030250]|uniref:ATP-binding protein n=1 Tax=Actinoplanes sp. GCM10030250 TaxID=3273376 RepID=UPI003605DC35
MGFAQGFSADEVSEVRHAAQGWIRGTGLAGDAIDDFLVAVHELVINAAIHGGGHGALTLRLGRGILVAEITDRGPGFPGGVPESPALPPAMIAGGRGLALARMFSDAMAIVQKQQGVTAMVTLRVTALQSDAVAPPPRSSV